jgi:hypothetical protein
MKSHVRRCVARVPLLLPMALLFVLGCGGTPSEARDATGDDGSEDDGFIVDRSGCLDRGGAGATSGCLEPRWTPEYYADQSSRYFDTLDVDADPKSVPNYSALVARWEWPPWLLLTGYEREQMIALGDLLKQFDPSTVPVRDCRAFAVQPFGRCYVVMEYEGGACPIYEEFTFNDAGEMTFIEAWSDLPGMLPTADAADRWAEGVDVHRLSTRIPGLGNATGTIDLNSVPMAQAAATDADIADFVTRARDFWNTWYAEYQNAGDDLFQRGCGW